MAFHHLIDPGAMILKLKGMLKSGGRLAIIDLDKEDGTFHSNPDRMGVKHFGFEKDEICSWAEKAPMKIQYQLINKIEKNDRTYSQFLAVFSESNIE